MLNQEVGITPTFFSPRNTEPLFDNVPPAAFQMPLHDVAIVGRFKRDGRSDTLLSSQF